MEALRIFGGSLFRSGAMKQITNFPAGLIRSFNWSPDGKTLFLVRGSVSSDIILLKSAKN